MAQLRQDYCSKRVNFLWHRSGKITGILAETLTFWIIFIARLGPRAI